MKINYIADSRLPSERANGYAIMKMCEEMSSLGSEVALVVPDRRNNLGVDPFEYYDIKKNFKILKLPSLDLLGKTFLFGRLLYLADLLSFEVSLLRNLSALKSANIYSRNYLLLLPFLWAGSDLYIELHDMPSVNKLFIKVLNKCKKIFTLTKISKNDIVELGIDPAKIEVLADGVDLGKMLIQIDKRQAREQLSLPLNKKIALYWGQFYDWKGVNIMAEAAKYLDDSYCLLFVGGADNELECFKKAHGLNPKIIIVPFQKRDMIVSYMSAVDIVVLPNSEHVKISSSYTSPLKLFEYMASRRPIVASDLPSLREILSENNSVLVRPDNPEALANGLKQIVSDIKLSDKISARAFIDVQNYTWTNRAKKVLENITR